MRSAVGQAGNAYKQAVGTATDLGGRASGINANLTPFLTSEMLHPQGLGQEGIAAETSAALGGAGGAASGFVGQAAQRAAASRNPAAFQASLADAARSRDKAAALGSEQIQSQNEQMKEQQRQAGAGGLEKLYGVDTSGMLESQGQEAGDINAEVGANKTGWLQNVNDTIATLSGAAKAYKPGGY